MEETYKNDSQRNQVDSPTAVWGLWNNPGKHLHSLLVSDSLSSKFRNKTEDDLTSNSSDGESSLNSGSGENNFFLKDVPSSLTKTDNPELGFEVNQDLSKTIAKDVFDIRAGSNVADFVKAKIDLSLESGSFLVTDLAAVAKQFDQWKTELPMVEPFYAVKCNPDPAILRLLASLGCSFDCATMGEIDLVLNGLGDLSFAHRKIASTSIVYANPAKMEHMLEFAVDNGVRMTVFDGEDELYKIASIRDHKSFQLLLRLTTDDRASICRFSKKFGCPVEEAPKLLEIAKSLGLNIAGVSFHVGSGCGDSAAYSTALEHARKVFECAESLGMPPMSIIDLGGGFPGDTGGYGGAGMPTFQDLAQAIRAGLSEFSSKLNRSMDDVRVIAEPGRYFVSASTTITTKVYSRKGGQNGYQALYVDDGVYGSFNNVVYDHATPIPKRLVDAVEGKDDEQKSIPTAIFGPTCDGLDQMCSLENTYLPRCEVGDWLVWENQGAYTHTASFVFNGYTHIPKKFYVRSI